MYQNDQFTKTGSGQTCMSREKLRGNLRICSAGRLDSYQEEWGERHIHPRRIELAIKAGCEPVFCEQVPSMFKNSAVFLSPDFARLFRACLCKSPPLFIAEVGNSRL
jgi:hypothetical protein